MPHAQRLARRARRAVLATSLALAWLAAPGAAQIGGTTVQPVPEIDSGLTARALALLFGGLLILTSRRELKKSA